MHSPLFMTTLLHIHSCRVSFPFDTETRPFKEVLLCMEDCQLIKRSDDPRRRNSPQPYETTAKGELYMNMVLSTPFPVQETKWVDPREASEEEVK